MEMRFMSPAGAENMLRIIQDKVPPPPEITQLKEEIENRTNAAEVSASVTGEVDQGEVKNIVALKLRLDALYGKWCEGEL
ncbi:MAG: hypothetical protein NUV78_03300 [Candidatus Zambryskibacteria bacterium]|nr:hypothetical protein [Candidatus Zambryskibacteria bacterium]